jgi:hypothetical protein
MSIAAEHLTTHVTRDSHNGFVACSASLSAGGDSYAGTAEVFDVQRTPVVGTA